ncbi:hypothetical protein [Photobacterium aquae]|uniref:hypothetical protein n=1 Tax=Photobacterium aquae TaxID=1195763 RepID=UPI000ADDEB85|nr:hypothetical protein [Photobacterium aquae]
MRISNVLGLAIAMTVSGCGATFDDHADDYVNLGFDLCGSTAKVHTFARSKNGRMRISCDDNRYFLLHNHDTLAYANELNGVYCLGKGFSTFRERHNAYSFECLDRKRFHIPK